MTIDEANAVMKYRVPVNVRKSAEHEGVEGQYYADTLVKNYHKKDRKWMYSCSLSQNQKSLYTIPITKLCVADGYEDFIADKVKIERKRVLKQCIRFCLAEHKTKKAINEVISKLIDEIKNDE